MLKTHNLAQRCKICMYIRVYSKKQNTERTIKTCIIEIVYLYKCLAYNGHVNMKICRSIKRNKAIVENSRVEFVLNKYTTSVTTFFVRVPVNLKHYY